MGQGPPTKRIKLKAERGPKRPAVVRLIITQPGPVDIRRGTANGHEADLIEAPEGTKIERPKENENGC